MSKSESERDLVKSFVARIQQLDEDARSLNEDRRGVYKEAKDKLLNTRAIKRLIADLRKDEEETEVFERYRSFVTGMPVATRPRADDVPQKPIRRERSREMVELTIDKSRPNSVPESADDFLHDTASAQTVPLPLRQDDPNSGGSGDSFIDPQDDIRTYPKLIRR